MRVKEQLVLKKKVSIFLNKLLLSIIILLIGMIVTKNNPSLKKSLKENIYEKSMKFSSFKKIYTKYFGEEFAPQEKKNPETKPVFYENINYSKKEKYDKGVKLTLSKYYPVPSLESGVIINIDNNKLTIEQTNGVEVTYSDIRLNNYKLYDYIEKGDIVGNTISEYLYLTFQKEGAYLDYQEYI